MSCAVAPPREHELIARAQGALALLALSTVGRRARHIVHVVVPSGVTITLGDLVSTSRIEHTNVSLVDHKFIHAGRVVHDKQTFAELLFPLETTLHAVRNQHGD